MCVCEREREREREREVLLTIKKRLKVGKHNALSVTPPLGAWAPATDRMPGESS